MVQNYASRVTLIIVVLLVGLFGVPFITGGIFSPAKFFSPSVPFNEKLNLRPGIDIAGGVFDDFCRNDPRCSLGPAEEGSFSLERTPP